MPLDDKGWMQVKPNVWIRSTSDGKVEVRKVQKVAETVQKCHEMRQESKGRVSRLESRAKSGYLLGVMPAIVTEEMNHVCGSDPEKRAMFMRDHPEYLTVNPREIKMGKRRKYIFPK